MFLKGMAAELPFKPWFNLSWRSRVSPLAHSAALCAAFNPLTLQRAWRDGSRWFM
jgi:hypothetical protein